MAEIDRPFGENPALDEIAEAEHQAWLDQQDSEKLVNPDDLDGYELVIYNDSLYLIYPATGWSERIYYPGHSLRSLVEKALAHKKKYDEY